MRLALEEARAAGRRGDVPVGAVVLDPGGGLLAAGGNERELAGDPTAHAEVIAVRRAATRLGQWRLTGCTLVVTLEPCAMCAGAIVASRVAHLARWRRCSTWCAIRVSITGPASPRGCSWRTARTCWRSSSGSAGDFLRLLRTAFNHGLNVT